MNNHLFLFTQEQGSLLVRLLLAHVLSDFLFQTSKMVSNKKWFSIEMGLHILIVFISTFLLSGELVLSGIIAIIHWFTDSLKVELKRHNKFSDAFLFISDQLLHILTIIFIWTFHYQIFHKTFQAFVFSIENYKISLLLFGYAIVIWPAGYLIKFATQNIKKQNDTGSVENESKIENGGKLIGQFERIIILTFVLLGQYEAIGFLITGKSIIRFAQKEENLRSEYVLVGTMMSYAISILIGVLVNWLFNY